MSASNASPSPSVPIGCPPPRQVIPLARIRAATAGFAESNAEPIRASLGTVGTPISFSNAHAGKNDFGDSPETYVFAHNEKVLEKRVPTVPSPPDLAPMVCALPYDHPRFREPDKGEVVVGL